jgi:hypothetical protein
MDDMISYDHSFKVKPENFNFRFSQLIYYIELLEDEKTIVWWKADDKWECVKEYTKSDFKINVDVGAWIIQ